MEISSRAKNTLLSVLLLISAGYHSVAMDRLRLTDLLKPLPTINASIPTPHETMKIEVGERHWYNHEIRQYLDALAEASPRMVALGEHARSHGGRPLVSYIISSPNNLARLDDIRAARQDIINPSAKINLKDQPAILHLSYSIHGNEPSGGNTTPLVAYYLNASEDAELVEQLEKVVILLNPVMNPDGFDRFAMWSNSHRGQVPSADPNDREHDEAFPGGRTNYYWFDLNRDWLPHQHPESQGRLKLFHEWKPNVQIDFHEQGSNSSYFFMPGKPERTNPLTPGINQELTRAIAEFHKPVFDKEGILYFSEEGYDDFFMGKGSTYPDLYGCVGILFEQPSSRGAQQATVNGLLTFPFSIANQFRTSLSSLKATAKLKDELLDYQRGFYRDVAKEKLSGYYLATAEGDLTRLREFVRILNGHEIEVEVLTESIDVDGVSYPANTSIAIPLDQTQTTYLRTLWDTQIEFEENIFYDVSTWTLPFAFNLQHTRNPVKTVKSKAYGKGSLRRNQAWSESNVGYLMDWRDSASPALLYALLETGANVRVASRPFTASLVGGEATEFGYGTVFVSNDLNERIPLDAIQLLKAAASDGHPVHGVASSSTSNGIDLGSREFRVLKLPQVLLATGPGIFANDVGEIWHMLDTRVQMPVTMVDTDRLGSVNFGDYTHILLTRGLTNLNDTGVAKVDQFIKDGGVLWVQGDDAIKWAIDKKLGVAKWRKTEAEKAKEKQDGKEGNGEDEPSEVERKPFADAGDEAAYRLVRGAIFSTSLDITHPIGYGYTSESLPVFRRTNKFLEPSRNVYSTPILYREKPLISGYVSPQNLELIGSSAGMIIDQQGSGAVVLAMDNPCFRAFWWGTQRLLTNVIFFGDLLEEPN